MLDQFQRAFYETTVKCNLPSKIIHINFKLVAQKYERGCVYFCKKHLSLNFDGKIVIKN